MWQIVGKDYVHPCFGCGDLCGDALADGDGEEEDAADDSDCDCIGLRWRAWNGWIGGVEWNDAAKLVFDRN